MTAAVDFRASGLRRSYWRTRESPGESFQKPSATMRCQRQRPWRSKTCRWICSIARPSQVLGDQPFHIANSLLEPNHNRPRDDAVSDVQLVHALHGSDRLHVAISEPMARVERQPAISHLF